MDDVDHLDHGWCAAGAWACYLGSSWTWVIGMFLPIILMRDFAWAGWLVFVLPNIFGAAVMGSVLRADSSCRLVARHRDMCLCFSEVTLALHAFVLGWLYTRMFGTTVVVIALFAAVLIQIAVHTRPKALTLGVWTTVISAILLSLGLIFGWPDAFGIEPNQVSTDSGLDLWMFALASVVGFTLCPYLDLTFHRVRQATDPSTGQRAFALGFIVIFLGMMIFSLAYASMLLPLFSRTIPQADRPVIPTEWLSVLMIHLTLQTAFTMGCHGREIVLRRGGGAWLRVGLIVAVGLLAANLVGHGFDDLTNGYATGETVFRIFLLAYGLAFPAYVFLCVIPLWRGGGNERDKVIVWALTTLVTCPMAYMGFVMSQSIWILVALAVLCAGRLALELTRGKPLQKPAA